MKKNNYKKIKKKNYVYALLVLVGAVLLTLYIFSWYQVKKEEKLLTSYLIKTNTIENNVEDIKSFKQISLEMPSSYFVYISYTKDEEVYNFEKRLKRKIDKYKLNDMFYYINVTDLKEENSNYLDVIKKELKIDKLDKIPVIIYVIDGDIKKENVLTGKNNKMVSIEDFQKLLDFYNFEKID